MSYQSKINSSLKSVGRVAKKTSNVKSKASSDIPSVQEIFDSIPEAKTGTRKYVHTEAFYNKQYAKYKATYKSWQTKGRYGKGNGVEFLSPMMSKGEFRSTYEVAEQEQKLKGQYSQNKIYTMLDTQQYNTKSSVARSLLKKAKDENMEGYEDKKVNDIRNMTYDEIRDAFGGMMSEDYHRLKNEYMKQGYSKQDAVKEAKHYISTSYYNSP